MNFEELNIKPEIVKALKEMGIVTPTLIQEKAIPLILEGKDVIGRSKTGSGKTAAFGVPILQNLEKQGLQAAIIVPTRELAVQITNELHKFGKYLKFNVATLYGGVSLSPQMDAILKANILVGTPGRTLDHLQRGTLDLSEIKCVVLDEADKMVEMGFIEDVSKILQCTPEYRQIILFGATISTEIDNLKREYMHSPMDVEAETYVKEDFLKQYYYDLKPNEKFSMLVHLLKNEAKEQVIIFCSSRATVELVSKNLRLQGIRNEMIHGKLSQNRRLRTIESFYEGKFNVLVASSVAARGLDIKNVSHVINYDLSQDPQEYVHRVGRTARAGESGKAITLLCQKDHDVFRQIFTRYRLNIEELPKGQFPLLVFKRDENTGNYHRKFDPRRRHGVRHQRNERPNYANSHQRHQHKSNEHKSREH